MTSTTTGAKLLTARQAADLLGLTLRRVQQLCDQGILAGGKWGRDWAIHRESAETYGAREHKPGPKKKVRPVA